VLTADHAMDLADVRKHGQISISADAEKALAGVVALLIFFFGPSGYLVGDGARFRPPQ
jgi:hypothetical protein